MVHAYIFQLSRIAFDFVTLYVAIQFVFSIVLLVMLSLDFENLFDLAEERRNSAQHVISKSKRRIGVIDL